MAAHITDHVARALARLPDQFKGKTKLELLLTTFIEPFQEIEDVFWQLLVERTLDVAIGKQLDDIGAIVQFFRDGANDDTYRRLLRARIKVLRSRGTGDELLQITRLIINDATATVTLVPEYPAALVIRIDAQPLAQEIAEMAIGFLRKAASGGVRIILEFTTLATAGLFRWDTGPGWDSGYFADAIE